MEFVPSRTRRVCLHRWTSADPDAWGLADKRAPRPWGTAGLTAAEMLAFVANSLPCRAALAGATPALGASAGGKPVAAARRRRHTGPGRSHELAVPAAGAEASQLRASAAALIADDLADAGVALGTSFRLGKGGGSYCNNCARRERHQCRAHELAYPINNPSLFLRVPVVYGQRGPLFLMWPRVLTSLSVGAGGRTSGYFYGPP